MEKLYYQSPYVREFEAVVLSCDKGKKAYEIKLDRTGFYPEGGGQPSDTGILGSARVLEVREKDGEIIHYTDLPLEPGISVKGAPNWSQRFSNMQNHSGEHIVSGLIHAKYGYDNVGFHMGREEVTIDLNGMLTWEQLAEIEREANEIVYQNIPIRVFYPSSEELAGLDYRSKKELSGQVRIVEVPGADRCACCGTHVEYTGEIGLIKMLSMMHYKGGVRISMLCGMRAMEDYAKKTDQTQAISVLLSAKPEKITEAVERMKKENSEKDAQLSVLMKELFHLKAERMDKQDGACLVFEDGLLPVQVRQFCNLLMEQEKGEIVGVCSGNETDGYSYCAGSRKTDMKAAGKRLNEALSGRGGGSSQMIQGTFKASRKEIEEIWNEIFNRKA